MNAGKTLLMLSLLAFSVGLFGQNLKLQKTDSRRTVTVKKGAKVKLVFNPKCVADDSKICEEYVYGKFVGFRKDSFFVDAASHYQTVSLDDVARRSDVFFYKKGQFTGGFDSKNIIRVEFQNPIAKKIDRAGIVLFMGGLLQSTVVSGLGATKSSGDFDYEKFVKNARWGWAAMAVGLTVTASINTKKLAVRSKRDPLLTGVWLIKH